MPDVEQKHSAPKSSICTNSSNPDNTELQARLKDILAAVANLGRIAESFAWSTGLRLVPVRSKRKTIPGVLAERFSLQNQAPNPPWAGPDILQRDFHAGPMLVPAAILNSTHSSVFAHSTGPARSVHWPSSVDAPTTSWVCSNSSAEPPFTVNFCGCSRGMRSGGPQYFRSLLHSNTIRIQS